MKSLWIIGSVPGSVGRTCEWFNPAFSCSAFCRCCALVRTILLIELTEGTLFLSQILSWRSLSRISHAKILGFSCLYSSIFVTTFGVATLGLLPPITPGLMEPVSKYLPKILLTQPCDTLNCRLISHGRTPPWESSTIFRRMGSGRGRPFTNRPPSWFTPPCPLDPFAISEVSSVSEFAHG